MQASWKSRGNYGAQGRLWAGSEQSRLGKKIGQVLPWGCVFLWRQHCLILRVSMQFLLEESTARVIGRNVQWGSLPTHMMKITEKSFFHGLVPNWSSLALICHIGPLILSVRSDTPDLSVTERISKDFQESASDGACIGRDYTATTQNELMFQPFLSNKRILCR